MKRLLTEASLIMKPEGQADGLLPSVKPIDGSGDFTFSRGSNLAATRVNQAGLIEKGRENLLLQSNQFDTTWTTSSATPISGYADRNGGTNAWVLRENALSAAQHWIRQSSGLYSGIGTFSFYAKKKDYDYIQFAQSGDGGNYANFNIADGTLGNSNSAFFIDRKIESVGNGWYRCSVTYSFSSNSFVGIALIRSDVSSRYDVYQGDGASGTYIQDAQVEQSLAATGYIETTTTTAKAGVLEDTPRLDYSGGATEPSLLLEPQRSNLITYSEYLNGSIWSHNSSTATINADVSPSGHNDATSLYISLANAAVFSRAYFTNVANSTHIGSVFLKKVEGAEVRLRISGTAASLDGSAIFNLDNGTYRDAVGSVTPSIESVGNGWYRCSIGDLSGSGIATPSFRIDTLGAQNDTTVLVWGVVVEVGTYPTSYIPTNGSAVTRGADDCSATGVSDVIGSTTGSGYVEFTTYNQENYGGIFEIINTSNLSQRLLIWVTSTDNQISLNVGNMGGVHINKNNVSIGKHKAVFTYTTSKIKFFLDGEKVGETTPSSLTGGFNKVDFYHPQGTVYIQKKEISQAVLFKEELTDAAAIAFTTL